MMFTVIIIIGSSIFKGVVEIKRTLRKKKSFLE